MPFSFIDIEERKNKLIWVLFAFLVFIYFLSAWILTTVVYIFLLSTSGRGLLTSSPFPPVSWIPKIFFLALVFAMAHWFFSVDDASSKIVKLFGAHGPDKDDRYHQQLSNIVDEVSVATGGRKFECVILPVYGVNAFSLDDLRGRAVIGVTEGLLARLNRAQLEAVIAHEAAHIITKDTLLKTIASSLFSIFDSICKKIQGGLSIDHSRHVTPFRSRRGSGLTVLLYLVSLILYALNKTVTMFISRQCEYRADAIAVRLTRNPLSLAEALYIISRGWRIGGSGFDALSSLFILNTNYSSLDEKEGVFSNLFSTHPPLNKRLGVLLDMSHSGFESLLDAKKRRAKHRHTRTQSVPVSEAKWHLANGKTWHGPFMAREILSLAWAKSDTFIRREGSQDMSLLWQDAELSSYLRENAGQSGSFLCPRCRAGLSKTQYEGVPVYQCAGCTGVLISDKKLPRVIAREERGFSDEVVKQAELLLETTKKGVNMRTIMKSKMQHEFSCPKCSETMMRRLYTLTYPIEVDSCSICKMTWYDKNELEIIQYLIEKVSLAKDIP
ncbi:M48 family metalloprotease [Candidatus Omnitrophota bacterium]